MKSAWFHALLSGFLGKQLALRHQVLSLSAINSAQGDGPD
jgi:hypothetical protein